MEENTVMDRADLQGFLEEGASLAEIGRRVGLHEATVGYWLKKHGLEAASGAKYAARGGIARDTLEALVEEGLSIAQIAERVGRSKGTVRHWLQRYGLKTQNGRGRGRSEAVRSALEAGQREVLVSCARHGEASHVIDGRGYYRCRRCRAEAVSRRRRKVKTTLVQEAGGACCLCGYAENMRALHFHHLEPAEKRFELNAKGVALAIETLRVEARKCVLLCSNCHAEVEDGLVSVPVDALEGQAPSGVAHDDPG
jgi:transposase